ncbi:hypothetical protein C2G38_2057354, partial [Gigaspora rosea]
HIYLLFKHPFAYAPICYLYTLIRYLYTYTYLLFIYSFMPYLFMHPFICTYLTILIIETCLF